MKISLHHFSYGGELPPEQFLSFANPNNERLSQNCKNNMFRIYKKYHYGEGKCYFLNI